MSLDESNDIELSYLDRLNLKYFENSNSSCSATKMSTPQTSPTDSISSPFYQNVGIPVTPEIKIETHKSFKTIHNGEIMKNTTKNWENLPQPDKKLYLELIQLRIRDYDKSDCQILIGEAIFNCYKIVLQSYSNYFKNLKTVIGEVITLPADEVTAVAFMKIYEWMLTPTPQVKRKGIIEIYKASKFLEIKELKNQIEVCFDNCLVFDEDTAFSLYWEARSFNETDIKEIMLIRIQKYFLTIVATREFLEMTCEEVCSFLAMNSICVRKESDVFYSGLKWLTNNWEEREQYVIEVMKCIRFVLMFPWELTELRKNNKSLDVQKVTVIPGVLEMIDNAIRIVTLKCWTPEKSDKNIEILMKKLKVENYHERNWIKNDFPDVPDSELDRFEIFCDYLKMISLESEEYWRKLEFSDLSPTKIKFKGKCNQSYFVK